MGRELALAFPQLVSQLRARWASLGDSAGWIYDGGADEPSPLQKLWGSTYLCQLHAELARTLLRLRPQAAIGLCSGETNALYALGAWNDLDAMVADIARAGIYESELAGALRRRAPLPRPGGGRAARLASHRVLAPLPALREALAREPRAHLAIINAPGDAVIVGDASACARVLDGVGRERARPLGYDMAVHCPELSAFEHEWRRIHRRPTQPVPGVRFYTHASCDHYQPTEEAAADALLGQAKGTVDFPRLVQKAWTTACACSWSTAAGRLRALDLAHPRRAPAPRRVVRRAWRLAAGPGGAGDRAARRGWRPSGSRGLERRPRAGSPEACLDAVGPAAAVRSGTAEPPTARARAAPAPAGAVAAAGASSIRAAARDGAARGGAHECRLAAAGCRRGGARARERGARGVSPTAGPSRTDASSISGSLPGPSWRRPRRRCGRRAPSRGRTWSCTPPAGSPRCSARASRAGRLRTAGADARAAAAAGRPCDRSRGEPMSMGRGTVWTETDVREDAFYLHAGRMPAGILIEAGQADLFLISWLGVDALNQGERVYRLLGCELVYHGGLPAPGETLRYDIHVDGHARQGDVRLFFFHSDCRSGDKRYLSVREGQAGFFTDAELWRAAACCGTPRRRRPRRPASRFRRSRRSRAPTQPKPCARSRWAAPLSASARRIGWRTPTSRRLASPQATCC
jgi:hypothetical protein